MFIIWVYKLGSRPIQAITVVLITAINVLASGREEDASSGLQQPPFVKSERVVLESRTAVVPTDVVEKLDIRYGGFVGHKEQAFDIIYLHLGKATMGGAVNRGTGALVAIVETEYIIPLIYGQYKPIADAGPRDSAVIVSIVDVVLAEKKSASRRVVVCGGIPSKIPFGIGVNPVIFWYTNKVVLIGVKG